MARLPICAFGRVLHDIDQPGIAQVTQPEINGSALACAANSSMKDS